MKIPTALIGCHIDRTPFDYQVRLSLSALDRDEGYRVDAELVIETPFLLCDRDGEWHELDPAPAPPSRPPWTSSAEPSPPSKSAPKAPCISPSTKVSSCTSAHTRSIQHGQQSGGGHRRHLRGGHDLRGVGDETAARDGANCEYPAVGTSGLGGNLNVLRAAGAVLVDVQTGGLDLAPAPSGSGDEVAARFDPQWIVTQLDRLMSALRG
ncbi:DUF6188 family protein [Phytohabitans kaempferiae]|uniref:DUF6188 family protein n=1 Tax=Phytohabitans kaempferiae TaxID=1620943 RepID=UPI00406BBABF